MISLNGVEITHTLFPDHTRQVWKLDKKDIRHIERYTYQEIIWEYAHDSELILLAQLVDLIRSYHDNPYILLKLPYLPYARQDKAVSNDTTFGLKSFGTLLNSLKLDYIQVIDVHSQEAYKYINNLHNVEPLYWINSIITRLKATPYYPDKGALTRYGNMKLKNHNPNYYAIKQRCQKTGKIKSIRLKSKVKGVIIIVDDLCDKGGTFIQLAKKLYKAGAKEVHLYTSHGLYTAGIDVLREANIKRIFNYEREVK